jgi:hypothetical protein
VGVDSRGDRVLGAGLPGDERVGAGTRGGAGADDHDDNIADDADDHNHNNHCQPDHHDAGGDGHDTENHHQKTHTQQHHGADDDHHDDTAPDHSDPDHNDPQVRGGDLAAGHGVQRRIVRVLGRRAVDCEVVELQRGSGRERGRRLGADAVVVLI